MSSVYFFLVAEASASSSAPNTMSRGTFFSRASTSASITNSRFPDVTVVVVATRSSQFRHQPRPLDLFQAERNGPSFQFQAHLPRLGPQQHAHETPPPGRIGSAHPHVGLVPRKAGEVGFLAKRPV